MFSHRKDNLSGLGESRHIDNETVGSDGDVHDRNKFPLHSDSVTSSHQSSLLCLNEKRNKLLKLLERHDYEVEHFKPEERTDGIFLADRKTHFEETDESDSERLPLEISESEYEETKDNTEGDWRGIDENQCHLENICGLEDIKECLFNVLIYPSLYPQFFPRRIRWNQILLYGPPGTGKTMLAKAFASKINATMHRITSADLLSHWQGQTEKEIRNLFQEIHSSPKPKILFLDEIDGLFRKRTKDESDSTRRIKTEFLINLDDFTAEFENHQTFLIGATNCPWEIDSSFMRRFHKRIFVPLPDKKARLEIIKKSFENVETDLTDPEWNEIGDRTEGYSGAELVNVVMASCCQRFVEVKKCKYWKAEGEFWTPVNFSSLLTVELNFEDIHPEKVRKFFEDWKTQTCHPLLQDLTRNVQALSLKLYMCDFPATLTNEMSVRNIIFADLMEAIGKTPKTVEPEILLKYLEYSDKNKLE